MTCFACFHHALKEGEPLILPKGLLLVTHEPSVVNTAPGPHIRGNTLRANSMGDNEVDLLLPGTARFVPNILSNWFLVQWTINMIIVISMES